MSKTKTVYILTRGNFYKLQNQGEAKCSRCQMQFKENDIVATSAASHRYCYNCASKINLVSGELTKDLHLEESINKTTNHIRKITKNAKINKSIEGLALDIIKESFARSLIPSKNLEGLACAAIYFSASLLSRQDLDSITEQLPSDFRIIQKNFWTLRHILINSKIMEAFDGKLL